MVTARAAEPDIRAEIVRAATSLFAAHGFDGTALQDVADAVGVTKPAVLHHFPSKEHIRQAVLDGILAHWQETLPRLLLAATASADRFDAVFGELHRFFAADADRARVVLREVLDRPDAMRKLVTGPVRPWLQAVASYIRSGKEGGRHFADVDPEAYVIHMLGLVLAATASISVTSAALSGPDHDGAASGPKPRASSVGAEARARYDTELARIARASLFKENTDVPTKARSAAQKRKAAR